MKTLVPIVLSLLPSFLQVPLRRGLLNQKIGKGSKISFLSFVKAKEMNIGRNVTIKPLAVVNSEILEIGDNSVIKSLSFISTRIVRLKTYVHLANFCFIRGPFVKTSEIIIGDHSRVFPFCWLDTNRKITIGDHVGIGGFTLIFTHGVWSNYFKGGPVSFKEVTLEDNVWLPWRVFIMPGTTIGKDSIIGANSLVNGTIPPNSLAAGSPAKVLRNDFLKELSPEEIGDRLETAVADFMEYLVFKKKITQFEKQSSQHFISSALHVFIDESSQETETPNLYIFSTGDQSKRSSSDMIWNVEENTFYADKNNKMAAEFSDYIRRYGVRLNRIDTYGDLY